MDQAFYTKRIIKEREQLQVLKKKLLFSSSLRLIIFLAIIAGVYFTWHYTAVTVGIGAGGLILFLYLVSRHENLVLKRKFKDAIIDINTIEIETLAGDFTRIDDGERYKDDAHPYAQDIDLYGARSLYELLNRSHTASGKDALARWLGSNDINAIDDKQEAIKELSQLVDFRQEYSATAAIIDESGQPQLFTSWLKDYESFVPRIFNKLPLLLLIVNVVAIALYLLGWISGYIPLAVFFIGLAITGKYVKRITALAGRLSKLEQFFNQYSSLLLLIEQQPFNSKKLKAIKSQIINEKHSVSSSLKELGAAIGRLDQRNNMLFGFVANGLGLWDLKQVCTIEKWIATHSTHLENWLEAVAQIDAYNSLANYAFNNQNYSYPLLGSEDFKLEAQELIHPQLMVEKPVGNDVTITNGSFFIITGANMAGKSTFLRTVATTLVFSNVGLPIRAKSIAYNPIKLVTSMRTTDSLSDDESYFFSELKRLKYIVDLIETEPYFIVLDEILKGTNSEDKANGSRKLIERLTNQNATGIIATHDLSLTEITQQYDKLYNYYFDADITDDVLTFNYSFKSGVANTMNASFLLKKMGIV